ncbi:lipopolysaccharide biosynthesis protein, partial [Helicobacter pylori]
FDFVDPYGEYWGGQRTKFGTPRMYTKATAPEAPIENHEVTPPPPIPHEKRNKILLLKRNKTPKNYLSLAK